MSDGYGRSKPGRPKVLKAPDGPTCEICHHLRTADGKPVCGHWKAHELDATKCGDFKDASKPRVLLYGGITRHIGYSTP